MTREEAIEQLQKCKDLIKQNGHEHLDERDFPLLDIAIEALEREPSDDLISRAEAIEAIEIVDWYHQNKNKDMVHGANSDEHQAWYTAQDIYKALKAVPSADRPIDEFDGMIFSTDKYMAFIDKKEIHILRKGAHKVTVERMFNTEEDEE